MSYAWLLGLLIGIVAALVVVLLNRKRLAPESDERTQTILTQTGATAFYITMGFLILAWLFDNASAYLAGQPPHIVSPWSMMLGAALFIYAGSALFHQWRFSAWADLDAQEQKQVRRRAAALLCGAGALGGSARLSFERGQDGLGWFLIAFMALEVGLGFYLIILAKKKAATEEPR